MDELHFLKQNKNLNTGLTSDLSIHTRAECGPQVVFTLKKKKNELLTRKYSKISINIQNFWLLLQNQKL